MSIESKLQALLTASNAATGKTDTTLTDSVQSLIDGYGGGGFIVPDGLKVGTIDVVADTQYIPVSFDLAGDPYLCGFLVTNPTPRSRTVIFSVCVSDFNKAGLSGYFSSTSTLSHEGSSYIDEITKDGMRINATLCSANFVVPSGSRIFWFAS